MKPNLPGLPTISALMLTAVLTVWLGLWGTVDLSKLEKWQTLMTGFVALIAAGIAYRGATAKVRYDREVADREEMRRKVALFLKLEVALTQLYEKARILNNRFAIHRLGWEAADVALDEPPELEEAWARLDLFPRHVIAEIRNIRDGLRRLSAIKLELGSDTLTWANGDYGNRPWQIELGHSLAGSIWHAAELVAKELRPVVDELAPELDHEQKMIKIYGGPGEEIPF